MAYAAVKGGTKSIEQSIDRLTYERVQSEQVIDIDMIKGTMRGLIDQVMSESSLYGEDLAALAIKQAEGNVEEAVFLLRAHRSTLPRVYYTKPIETENMIVERRISASFKDIPGGQLLGATHDYSHRIMNIDLLNETQSDMKKWLQSFLETEEQVESITDLQRLPKVVDYLRQERLFPEVEEDNAEPLDVTKKSLQFPATRSERLQVLTRGNTGAVTSLGYAAIRGYGEVHPTVGELRVGRIPLTIEHPTNQNQNDEDDYYIGTVKVTEVESFIPVSVKKGQKEELEFEIGYGIVFGQNETKAIAMSILDYSLSSDSKKYPTEDEEFVLLHIDSLESSGFISHLKLPHYVTFQSKLDSVRKIKKEPVNL